ncbi:MAG: L,D-transpeptidase [Verrucomicrobiota bacterium]|nr:L,D-transpeptidase [Verrucomicrobiota bacterium]
MNTLTRNYFQACAQQGIVPTRFVLVIKIAHQIVLLFEKSSASPRLRGKNNNYRLAKKYRCSTSRFGIGEAADSNMTPRGLHRLAEKIGGGWPVGAVFKNRNFTGYTWDGQPYASITNRIFWLEGLEPGFNRGGKVDSHARYIYIHGTGDEPKIGRPASHGCIHLAANDLIPLYDKLPVGTQVWISEK